MVTEAVLTFLAFGWFAVHVAFPRGSQPSRMGGVFLALTFLELVVYWAITRGARS